MGFEAAAAFADRVYRRIGIGCNDSPPVGTVGAEVESALGETVSGKWTTTNDLEPANSYRAAETSCARRSDTPRSM
jgi:hypothetical protein